MATRHSSDKPAGLKTATTKKAATPAKKAKATGTPRARSVAPPAAVPEPTPGKKAEGLLRAGLKALGNVRDDVVKRQTHVIESLLGVKVNDAAAGFGFKKFEDVFDQRVATALERLGLLAGAQEIATLRDEVRQLRSELAALQGHTAPARRSARR